jgi:hypothetical protein
MDALSGRGGRGRWHAREAHMQKAEVNKHPEHDGEQHGVDR